MKKKDIKVLELKALKRSFSGVRNFVMLEPNRIHAELDVSFRDTLREKEIQLQMVKNTLFRKVLKDDGIDFDGDGIWGGPTLVAWGPENAKDLSKAIEKVLDGVPPDPKTGDKFRVKTAVADGQAVTLEQAKKLPTRQEAIADLLGALLGPAMNLSAAVAGPGANLAAAVAGPGATVGGLLAAIEQKQKEGEGGGE